LAKDFYGPLHKGVILDVVQLNGLSSQIDNSYLNIIHVNMCDITSTAEVMSLHKIEALCKILNSSNCRVGFCYKLRFLTACKLELTGELEYAGGIVLSLRYYPGMCH
jgi:hypothetical protein